MLMWVLIFGFRVDVWWWYDRRRWSFRRNDDSAAAHDPTRRRRPTLKVCSPFTLHLGRPYLQDMFSAPSTWGRPYLRICSPFTLHPEEATTLKVCFLCILHPEEALPSTDLSMQSRSLPSKYVFAPRVVPTLKLCVLPGPPSRENPLVNFWEMWPFYCVQIVRLIIVTGLTPGGPVPFMQDSNGMMFLSPNMSAFLNSPAPNNNNSGNSPRTQQQQLR